MKCVQQEMNWMNAEHGGEGKGSDITESGELYSTRLLISRVF
jgi:hypothetical protein